MSPYFHCFKCSRVYDNPQANKECPVCCSADGKTITDNEFNRQQDIGAMHLINPSTGKPIKNKKHK
jgi:Zn finger protein HypA/HybF involved in hydrogenase expression